MANEPSNTFGEPLFIGPKGEYSTEFKTLWMQLFDEMVARRQGLFSQDPTWRAEGANQLAEVESGLESLVSVLQAEIPTFSPHYLGHMISDTSVPALLGHMAVLFENPNLASREAATAGSQLEVEAINALAAMVGYPVQPARGHFTSGGTVANFEAFWRARYRLDHWLSMGSWLVEHGRAEPDFFKLGLMGWESFRKSASRLKVTDNSLRDRSWVLKGPWAISRYYRDVLQCDFPEPVMLVPGNKHYSWPKCANVFGLSENAIWSMDLDAEGRVSVASLEERVEEARAAGRPILMVVSVAGTTELGMIDPVDQVADRLDRYREEEGLHIWHHVDAAYGGYLCSTLREGESVLNAKAQSALRSLGRASSITLDPHKLGFVPYACGAFLVPNAENYAVSSIKAPYLAKEPEAEFPTWSTTLEGSRAATGAGAVWLSSKVLPLTAYGHGAILNRSIETTREFFTAIEGQIPNVRMVPASDSNIVCFTIADPGARLSDANRVASSIVDQFKASPNFSCTRTALGFESYRELISGVVSSWGGEIDTDHMLVVRMVVMNPYMDERQAINVLLEELLAEINDMVQKAVN